MTRPFLTHKMKIVCINKGVKPKISVSDIYSLQINPIDQMQVVLEDT